MRRERVGHTLQTTALVNEAFMRLEGKGLSVKDRGHFLTLAARTMRRVLVDHARGRDSQKRGGNAIMATFDEAAVVDPAAGRELLEIDEALEKLAQIDAGAALAIEVLFFGGLTYEEAAAVTEVSKTELFNDVQFGKAWLKKELSKR